MYYQDGVLDVQINAMHDAKGSLEDLVPVTLRLDGLLPISERIGDALKATMEDEKIREQKRKVRKNKASKPRAAKVKEGGEWCLGEAVNGEDCSHRERGLWAVDIANPNAWSGANEYLNSSAADFIAVQETKVEGGIEADAENTARNLGWSVSVSTCLQGAGGGNSAGVAVACRKHIWDGHIM